MTPEAKNAFRATGFSAEMGARAKLTTSEAAPTAFAFVLLADTKEHRVTQLQENGSPPAAPSSAFGSATDALLFDTYSSRRARTHSLRGHCPVLNIPVEAEAKGKDEGGEDVKVLHGDEILSDERELRDLLPKTFVGDSRPHFEQPSIAERSDKSDGEAVQRRGSRTSSSHLTHGFFLWHQAFDDEYWQHYYYRESTQETQWKPPTQGFVPISYEHLHSQDAFVQGNLDSSIDKRSEASQVPHRKYWSQRHRLFSLFDHGIRLDKESWFSVTPERIANHQAQRCHSSLRACSAGDDIAEETTIALNQGEHLVVLDAFCGVAGNTIAFARRAGVQVIAYDLDSARLELASHNADVYGVRDSIEFVCNDVVCALKTGHFGDVMTSSCSQQRRRHRSLIDMIFLSPPWGGPEYIDVDNFDLRTTLVSGLDLVDLIMLSLGVTPNVACFLPRNTDLSPLIEVLSQTEDRFEVERNYLNGKCKAITLYFGDLASRTDSKESQITS